MVPAGRWHMYARGEHTLAYMEAGAIHPSEVAFHGPDADRKRAMTCVAAKVRMSQMPVPVTQQ